MVTPGLIMYPVMEDQFPRCRATQPPASEYEDAEPLIGMIGRFCGPVAVYMGRTRIILFSVTSGSHMKDQVADYRAVRASASPITPGSTAACAVCPGHGRRHGGSLWPRSLSVPPASARGRRRGHPEADLMSDQATM